MSYTNARTKMITSILQEMNSPTLVKEIPFDKGGKLYDKIENAEGNKFPVVIDYYLTGPETFEHSYLVVGNHGIPLNYLEEMIVELIQKAI